MHSSGRYWEAVEKPVNLHESAPLQLVQRERIASIFSFTQPSQIAISYAPKFPPIDSRRLRHMKLWTLHLPLLDRMQYLGPYTPV